jgi:GDP-mannose 6-dehydrogenase
MADTSQSGVVVLGLGYVGCVTAACLAELGHRVVGVDRDAYKVECVHEGRAPFYEPGLDELVAKNAAAGRLRASTRLADVLDDADVALICVGTPSDKNGNIGLEQLRRVCAEIAELLLRRGRRLIVAVRSTVFPGTCEEVVMPVLGNSHNAAVVCNPEFLREGIAVRDFMEPSLVVVGSSDAAARQQVAGLYAALGVEPSLLDLRTAEMIKYACNTFHALKIDFANEMGALCAALGISPKQVMETLCRDVKLNISPAYLKPGLAFGGSCLPKDLRALAYRATRLDLKLPLLESVLASNDEHLARAIRALLDLPAKRIGFFGLAFKENTDDLRESTVVAMLEAMIGKGRDVRVFDPHIRLDQIYGSNRAFVFSAIPHISKLVDFSLDAVLGWAEHLVITQKPASPFAEAIRRSGVPVLDLSGQFTAAKARVSG